MKLAVLSNINLDPMASCMEGQGFLSPYFAGYGQYITELVNPASRLNNENFELVFIHLDAEELLKDKFFSIPDSTPEPVGMDSFFNILSTWASSHKKTIIVISELQPPPFSFTSYMDTGGQGSFKGVFNSLNAKLREICVNSSNIIAHDFPRLVLQSGYKEFYAQRYWYLGRIKYTSIGFKALAEDFRGIVDAYMGKARKVLVLDLDNTLWGGVVGEDGVEGIKISEEGIGKAYRDFQKAVRSLKGLGVLLAINSKNNEPDVVDVFAKNSMMVLGLDDFVARKINWNNKVQNMGEIASELNLGMESFVFIDDNPGERDLVRSNIPGIAVPDFPEDPAELKEWFLRDIVYQYFPKFRVTSEDLQKDIQYKRNAQREQYKAGFNVDLAAFIKGLDITLKVHKNPFSFRDRLSQLSQKTNQFNLTTRRYSVNEIEALMGSGDSRIFALEYSDKFGSEGVIGLAILRFQGKTAHIDSFLLSCRVIGRDVERQFLALIAEDLIDSGIDTVKAEFIPTKKNEIAANFYVNCGMRVISPGNYEVCLKELTQSISAK